MPMIEIPDGSDVHLAELLDHVAPTADLHWSVLELWAVAQDEHTDVIGLERQAANSETGLEVTEAELRELAGKLAQVIDGIVAGYHGAPPSRSDRDLRDTASIVIEAIDSTLWRVYAQDSAPLHRLRDRFNDVRDVIPEVAIPPLHERS